jgi:Cu(I)/Ag(I) efflux system membrane protein CusA/SilA
VAVGVGFIALAGVAVETGVLMLVYLNHAWDELVASGKPDKAACTGRSFTAPPCACAPR